MSERAVRDCIFRYDLCGIQENEWLCYLIISQNTARTYVGCTLYPRRRIKQHNGIIKGGARSTTTGRPWIVALVVTGFTSKKSAMTFEYWWKHPGKRLFRARGRIEALAITMHKWKRRDWYIMLFFLIVT